MSDQKRESLFQKQKKVRPKLEDVISEYLEGYVRQNALEFAEWIRANKMNPQWASANSWVFGCRGKRAGYIKLRNDSFCIMPYNGMGPWSVFSDAWEKYIREAGLAEIVWENIKFCEHCLPCAPGRNLSILGKDFKNVCNSMVVYWNPDKRTMDCVKKLIAFRKELIIAGKA